MKKIIRGLGTAALAAIIGFTMAACGGTGSGADRTLDLPPAGNGLPPAGNGLPPAGDGHITFDAPHTFPVFTRAGTPFDGDQTFTYIERWDEAGTAYLLSLYDILNAPTTVSITGGTLSLQLGTPTTSAPWMDASDLPGFTVTPGLRLFVLGEFTTSDRQAYLQWRGTNGFVSFFYANKAGRVSGEWFSEGERFVTNLALEPGWNTGITTWTASEEIIVTGRPSNDFRWVR